MYMSVSAVAILEVILQAEIQSAVIQPVLCESQASELLELLFGQLLLSLHFKSIAVKFEIVVNSLFYSIFTPYHSCPQHHSYNIKH